MASCPASPAGGSPASACSPGIHMVAVSQAPGVGVEGTPAGSGRQAASNHTMDSIALNAVSLVADEYIPLSRPVRRGCRRLMYGHLQHTRCDRLEQLHGILFNLAGIAKLRQGGIKRQTPQQWRL